MDGGACKKLSGTIFARLARLPRPSVTAPALLYLLRPCSRAADGLYLLPFIPFPSLVLAS